MFHSLQVALTIIIALSVLKDVMGIRLALGKYHLIMEQLEDEALKEETVSVKETIDREILKVGHGLWHGLWNGLVISSWIWAFVLFDTLSSSAGVIEALWVLVLMIAAPFISFYALLMLNTQGNGSDISKRRSQPLRFSALMAMRTTSRASSVRKTSSNHDTKGSHNPMLDLQIEMRSSELNKLIIISKCVFFFFIHFTLHTAL
jgi:hypothetical protein